MADEAGAPRGGVWREPGGRLRWGWRLLAFLLLFAGLWLTLNQIAAWLDLPWMTGAWAREWGVVSVLLALLVASWVMMEGVEGMSLAAMGLPLDGETAPNFLRGTLLGGVLMGAVILALWAGGWLTWSGEPGLGRLPVAFLRLTAFFALAAFAEELLARGYPLQVMAEGMGGPAAVALTAAAFSLLHFWNPGVDAMALVNLGLAGALLGVAYWQTYSLWYATGVHFGWNWTMNFAADLPVSGMPLDTPGFEASVRGPELLTGGAFGPEAGLLVTAVTLGGVGWLLWSGRVERSLRILALRPIPERRREGDGRPAAEASAPSTSEPDTEGGGRTA